MRLLPRPQYLFAHSRANSSKRKALKTVYTPTVNVFRASENYFDLLIQIFVVAFHVELQVRTVQSQSFGGGVANADRNRGVLARTAGMRVAAHITSIVKELRQNSDAPVTSAMFQGLRRTVTTLGACILKITTESVAASLSRCSASATNRL